MYITMAQKITANEMLEKLIRQKYVLLEHLGDEIIRVDRRYKDHVAYMTVPGRRYSYSHTSFLTVITNPYYKLNELEKEKDQLISGVYLIEKEIVEYKNLIDNKNMTEQKFKEILDKYIEK